MHRNVTHLLMMIMVLAAPLCVSADIYAQPTQYAYPEPHVSAPLVSTEVPVYDDVSQVPVDTTTTAVSEIASLFNILVGFMFVAAFATFCGGIIAYIVHFGNPQRITEGVKFMEWGVSILFVLVVFLGLTNFIRAHAGPSNLVIAIVITVGIIFVLLSAFAAPAAPPPKK